MVRQIVVPYFSECTLLDLLLVAVAAGIGEEVLFRGLIQSGLSEWFSPWLALALCSLLFGLCHFITPAYVVFAGIFGLLLGGLWMWQENLLAPIVAHAAYDFFALVYVLRLKGPAKAPTDQPPTSPPLP
jgi:membrane protease YdiL (CAAX protease family)